MTGLMLTSSSILHSFGASLDKVPLDDSAVVKLIPSDRVEAAMGDVWRDGIRKAGHDGWWGTRRARVR